MNKSSLQYKNEKPEVDIYLSLINHQQTDQLLPPPLKNNNKKARDSNSQGRNLFKLSQKITYI